MNDNISNHLQTARSSQIYLQGWPFLEMDQTRWAVGSFQGEVYADPPPISSGFTSAIFLVSSTTRSGMKLLKDEGGGDLRGNHGLYHFWTSQGKRIHVEKALQVERQYEASACYSTPCETSFFFPSLQRFYPKSETIYCSERCNPTYHPLVLVPRSF